MNGFLKLAILVLFVAVFSLPVFVSADEMATTCANLLQQDTNACKDLSATDCRAALQKCADYYDQQSSQIAKDITKTTAQKNTLQNKISGLKKQISGLQADINQGTIMVKGLNLQINDTQVSINKTTGKINQSQEEITQILRAIYEEDQKPTFVILAEGNLSDFFNNIAYSESLSAKINELLTTTKNLKSYLQTQQDRMDNEVNQLQKTIAIQSVQKKQSEQAQQQQQQYLQMTETQYQLQLQTKQLVEQNAAKIKARLFQIAGVTKLPTFGEAIEVAKSVSKIVTIRPAFLLAVISQESAIGKNVGQCLLTNTSTGAGKRISTGQAMSKVFNKNGNHPKDLGYFLQITASVGRDPLNSQISCDGYGSMGPAQFLPATWMLFADRLKIVLGQTADPWAIKDSFTASAMYLSDLGAGAQTTTTESNAAYRYNGSGNAARIYSRTVMTRATCIQTFIDSGTMSTSCQNLIF